MISSSVSEQRLGIMAGNTHPLARVEFDQGLAPADLPMPRMLLFLKHSAAQESALLKLLDEQQRIGSPDYHRWLTPEQFGQRFGVADSDIAQITSWLHSHGFTVNSVSNGRTVIEFSGTAGSVEGAFHTEMHKYKVNGNDYWANNSDPQIPSALMTVIFAIPSLNSFFSAPQVLLSTSTPTGPIQAGSIQPQYTTNGAHFLGPADFGVIYNTNPLLNAGTTGTGTVIGIVGRSNINVQDVLNFRTVFGLPANTPNIIVNGPDPGNLGGNEEIEAVLDTSWSGAIAPQAKVDLVISASTTTTDGVLLSEQYIVDHNLANVMSESFGDCEAHYSSSQANAISSMAQQAAAEGITYVVATGDSGSAGCDAAGAATALSPAYANVLATNPYNVAVGGTQFNEGSSSAFWNSTNTATNKASALSYIPEEVWNNNCAGSVCNATGIVLASGGGASIFFAKPSWQTGVPSIPNDGKRDIPDVSLSSAGHDAYLLCLHGSCSSTSSPSFTSVYGTSAATPSFAGVLALVSQKTGARLGLANTMLYRIAAAQSWAPCNSSNTPNLPLSSCIFHDVTVGTNAVPGEKGYNTASETYPATVGYDIATGLGSVNAAELASVWSSGGLSLPTPPFSVSPASGSGTAQAFIFTFTDANGAADIAQAQMLITGNDTTNQACYLEYQSASNALYLFSDGGTATGPTTPGSSSILSNSQCGIAASTVLVSALGNTLKITVTESFKSLFTGSKSIMMNTYNKAGVASGWSVVGSWTVPANQTVTPTYSVSPASGSGLSQTFAFTFGSSAGASDIWQSHMLITGNGTGNQACYLMYQASNNALYLMSDGGASFTGPLTPGGTGTLSNSQCSVAASSVSVEPSGNTLKITETFTFKSAFTGSKTTMMNSYSNANVAASWATVGTWTVSSTPPPPPFSVSPASGSGLTQNFTFTFTDAAGTSDIRQGHMLITGNGTGNHACYLMYQAANNALYLMSDGGTSFTEPVTPGGTGTLSNSQCAVPASGISVSTSGNTLTVTGTATFTSAFAGSKTTMMNMYNNVGVAAGWTTVGAWTVPGTPPPPPFAVSPASGSGATQAFMFSFTESAGASDVWQGHMLITGNGTGNQACYLMYQTSNNALYLMSDSSDTFTGPVTPGGSGTLSNNQCSVAASSVSITSSDNTLEVRETIAFKSMFTGDKNTMMFMYNNANVGTGWATVGTWIIDNSSTLANEP
jgi:Pro-kumamolisin, activation domain